MTPFATLHKKEDNQKITPFSIRQAIVALELGPSDESLLDYMDFLAGHFPIGAAYFIHVLPRFDLFNALYEREQESLVSNFELNQEVIQRMDMKIRHRLTKREAIHVEFDVREGDPLDELLNDSEDLKADLVLIGQRSDAERHGILAKNLARKAPCNSLIVPNRSKARIERILVPVDFSPHSVKALQTAAGIRKQFSHPVQITCLNVFDMPNLSVYKIQKSRQELKEMMKKDREEAFRAFLHAHVPEYENEIETVLVERVQPGIASYLMEHAKEHHFDLIVIGAQGHSKVELLLLGSVTEKLLSVNDRIPTLVVR